MMRKMLALLVSALLAACGQVSAGESTKADDSDKLRSASQALPEGVSEPGTLRELVRLATVTVVATVSDVRPGRTLGEDGELSFLETELVVDEVLAGSVPSDSVVLETEEFGHPYLIEWQDPGTKLIVFLTKKGDDQGQSGSYYRPVFYDTLFVVDGDDVQATARVDGWELIREMADMTPQALAQEIRAQRNGS